VRSTAMTMCRVSDGLVADDCHDWREHEHDEADGHRRTHSGKDHGEHEYRRCTGEQGDVERVNGTDQHGIQREEREDEHRYGKRYRQYCGGSADVGLVPM
jgi:hypothetical protein